MRTEAEIIASSIRHEEHEQRQKLISLLKSTNIKLILSRLEDIERRLSVLEE